MPMVNWSQFKDDQGHPMVEILGGACYPVEVFQQIVKEFQALVKAPKHTKLTRTQEHVLRNLREHGFWSRACGWHWGGFGRTERVLDALVKRGYATRAEENGRLTYRPVAQS